MAVSILTLAKPARTNKQIQEYLSAVDRGLTGRFVMQSGKGWYVRKPDTLRGRLFATKAKAISKAHQELAKSKGELFIFDKNGQLIGRQ
ncbi:MAG: DUF2188 domain-containing protein [Candidatus Saccharimonadales bacterium]